MASRMVDLPQSGERSLLAVTLQLVPGPFENSRRRREARVWSPGHL